MGDPWQRREVIGDAVLYLADNADIREQYDLMVTSPPYGNQRNYIGSDIATRMHRGTFDWDDLMLRCFANADPKAQLLVNLGLTTKDGEYQDYHAHWREWMKGQGWRLAGWYVWDKTYPYPGRFGGALSPSHEWIFHFAKTVREPRKWVPGISKGRSIEGIATRGKGKVVDACVVRIAESVVRVPRSLTGAEDWHAVQNHPAVFPVQLPREIIMSYSDQGEIVCDPFLGSGTTGVAAIGLGRRFIGIENNSQYFELACDRIDAAQRQARLFA